MPSTRSTNPPTASPPARRGIGVGNGIGVGKRPAAPSALAADPSFDHAPFPGRDFELQEGGGELLDPIDPEILAIAQIVAQADTSSSSSPTAAVAPATLDEAVAEGSHVSEAPADNGEGEEEEEVEQIEVGEDDIHPALREIVNSLANAQQQQQQQQQQQTNGEPSGSQQMIDTGLEGTEEAELHATLANLGTHNFSSLFPSTFSHTEDSNFLLPEPLAEASSSTPIPSDLLSTFQSDPSLEPPITGPRGRGRPKGSKNKIQRPPIRKPTPPPKPPKPPKVKKAARKVGRPRKARTEEEEARFEAKIAERKAGVRRPRGRPRIFPGHLVRDLRLRENRVEFGRLKREAWESAEREGSDSVLGGEQGEGSGQRGELDPDGMDGMQGMEGIEEGYYAAGEGRRDVDENYDWSNDPQNLLQGLAQAGEIHPQEADQPDRPLPLGMEGAGSTERDLTDVLGLRGEHAEMAE